MRRFPRRPPAVRQSAAGIFHKRRVLVGRVPAVPSAPPAPPAPEPAEVKAARPVEIKRARVTTAAKRLADEHGVSVAAIPANPRGEITAADVRAFLKNHRK